MDFGAGKGAIQRVEYYVALLEFPDEPDWLCPHRHKAQEAAQECLDEELAVGICRFGQEIRQRRNAWGRPMKEAAEELEVSESTLSRVERGEVALTIHLIQGLLDCYQVPPAQRKELLDWYRKIRQYRRERRTARFKATRAATKVAG